MLPIKKILHPTDFSKPSEHALRFTLALARDYGAELLLLHVIEPPVYYGELGMSVPLPADFHEEIQARLGSLVPADSGVKTQTLLVEGNASREILRIAGEQHCDLLVLGTHGRTGLSRVLLGSVAEDIVRHATLPVLTLKTPILLSDEPAAPQKTASPNAIPPNESKSVLVL